MCISQRFPGDTDALSLRTIGIDQPLKKFGCEERKSVQQSVGRARMIK